MRAVLQRGLETIRLVGHGGLSVDLVVHLARTFACRVRKYCIWFVHDMHFNTFSNQTATIVSTDLCKCASCCQLVHAVNKLCCNQIFGTQLGILAGLALVDLNNGHKTIRVAVSRLLCMFFPVVLEENVWV